MDVQRPQVLVGQPAHHELLQEPAAGVVGSGTAPGRRHDPGRGFGREAEHGGAEGHLGVPAQGTLAAAHRPDHQVGHPGLALQAGHSRLVLGPDLDAVDEPFDRRQRHPALPQRRQDVLDVAQEQGVGPDHQHPLAFQGETVRIEKVCRTVQGHRRLAGTGAALDDHDAQERRADDLVLLPLDGGHDVPHDPGPGPFERGQEGAGAAELELELSALAVGALAVGPAMPVLVGPTGAAGPVGAGDRPVRRRGGAEPLVLDPHDPPTLGGEVATQDQPHRVPARGSVERLGHRGPPIDHQGLEVLARDPQPPDVEALGLLDAGRPVTVLAPVDPAEAQGLLTDVELVEAGQARADDDVTLLAELVCTPATLVDHGPDELLGVGPQLVEALVGPVHMGLFRLELRMRWHSRSLFTPVRSEPSIISSGRALSACRRTGFSSGNSEATSAVELEECAPHRQVASFACQSPTRRSCEPAGASRRTGSRCGSCARRDAPCPSTGPPGVTAASSTPSGVPSWRPS